MKKLLLFFIVPLVWVGCKKNATDRLVDPNLSGSVPGSSGIFTVYANELKTGGGLGLIPSGENQDIDLLDQSTPRSGFSQIRYSWNGQTVPNAGVAQHLFAGFSLLITPDFGTIDSATGRDLTGKGYTTLRFNVRGALSANTALRVEGPDDGTGGITPSQVNITSDQLGADWTEFTLFIPDDHFSNVKIFVTFSFQYSQPGRTTTPGNGGVIFVDNIRYTQS